MPFLHKLLGVFSRTTQHTKSDAVLFRVTYYDDLTADLETKNEATYEELQMMRDCLRKTYLEFDNACRNTKLSIKAGLQ